MVADSVFAPADSPYSHTSDALWTLWCIHDRTYGSAVLSGTYANKGGYHNKRENLSSSDYSSGRDVRNDDYGPGNQSAGLDVSMNPADMETWTKRLKSAATSGDPRCKIGGEWILREFIGTLDGNTVYCWVFTGGEPLGVGSDSGPDPGRDSSHLWHGHLSVIRKFLNNMAALQQIGSIVSGQSLAEWEEDDMTPDQLDDYFISRYQATSGKALTVGNYLRSWPHTYKDGGFPPNENMLSLTKKQFATVDLIAQKVDIDPEELAAIEEAAHTGGFEGASAAVDETAIANAIVVALQAAGLDPQAWADAIEAGVRTIFADAGTPDPPADPAP